MSTRTREARADRWPWRDTPTRRRKRPPSLKRFGLLFAGLLLLMGGASGGDGSSDSAGEGTAMTPAKPDATSSAIADYSLRGPYSVGMMTLTLADNRPVDVWYPAAEGAATGVERFTHNLNDPWPDALRAKLPPSEDVVVDAYKDIAASSDGPFPVILESHGFGSSRRDGANNHSHLASWGFVVIAPEHFERNRAAVIGQPVRFETLDDAAVLTRALELAQEESATAGSPLEGAVDGTRVAVDGISAGGRAALEFGADARIDAVMARAPAGQDVFDPPLQVPVLIIASDNDSLVELPGVEGIYEQLSPPRRLAVILKDGHNTFSDSCAQIWAGGGLDIAALSEATGFPPALLEAGNNGCTEEYTDPTLVWPLISHLQVAHVRAALGLDPDGSALNPGYIAERFPGLLTEYRSDE